MWKKEKARIVASASMAMVARILWRKVLGANVFEVSLYFNIHPFPGKSQLYDCYIITPKQENWNVGKRLKR